jgi:glycosyltransferase involved in cell wall biosynthesis
MSAYSSHFVPDHDWRLFGIPLAATVKRFAMRRSARVEALTFSIRDDLIARGIDPPKIAVAPCAFTDLSLCEPASVKRKEVVFVARFVRVKNPLLFVQAIPLVLRHDPGVHFWLLGKGPLEEQIREALQALNVADHVTVRFEPQPTRILNQSSVFVSLQTAENYPSQSLLEAMACGNAIVATDVGETWRLVDDTNGICVPATATEVAAAINALLDDPALPQRQQSSRLRVLTEHTSERFYAHMTDIYRDAYRNASKRVEQ